MRSTRMRSTAVVGGRPDDIEAQFYDALRNGDLAALMACWADEDDIVCVHPGGPRLVGTAQIRAGYEALFARGAPQVRHEDVRRVDTLASSVHSVIEKIALPLPDGTGEAVVVATNVFQKTAQGWRLVAHHASPGALGEALAQPDAPSQVLH
jgi:ketosteroid isomerase-like protein